MKRFLLLLSAIVWIGTPAKGQEAPSAGNYPEFSVIGRTDINPFSPSVYTLLEGSIGDLFSYSVSNLWVSDETSLLYANTFHADELNWLQWAWVQLDLGNFHIRLGKDCLTAGGFETDAYDFDQHPMLCSNFWNNSQLYQWGLTLSWNTPSESDEFGFNYSSSPFSVHPFDDFLTTKTFQWKGEHGPWSSIWGVSVMDYARNAEERLKSSIMLVSAGNQFEITDSFSMGLDYMLRLAGPFVVPPGGSAPAAAYPYNVGHNVVARINWHPLYWLEVGAKGIFETSDKEDIEEDLFEIPSMYWNGGAYLQIYPFKSFEGLRLHAVGGYDNLSGLYWSAGITVNLPVTTLLTGLGK